jgi:hypothetical protein
VTPQKQTLSLSIGGLSTGGTLSLQRAITDPESISGAVFLFSAALDIGPIREWVLSQDEIVRALSLFDQKLAFWEKIDFPEWMTRQKDASAQVTYGIGDHPFRYSTMFYNGAVQLVALINQIEHRYPKPMKKYADVRHHLFIAHSEVDKTAGIQELRLLQENRLPPYHTKFYPMSDVAHASVVLEDAIQGMGADDVLEPANSHFDDMMHAVEGFIKETFPILSRFLSGWDDDAPV